MYAIRTYNHGRFQRKKNLTLTQMNDVNQHRMSSLFLQGQLQLILYVKYIFVHAHFGVDISSLREEESMPDIKRGKYVPLDYIHADCLFSEMLPHKKNTIACCHQLLTQCTRRLKITDVLARAYRFFYMALLVQELDYKAGYDRKATLYSSLNMALQIVVNIVIDL